MQGTRSAAAKPCRASLRPAWRPPAPAGPGHATRRAAPIAAAAPRSSSRSSDRARPSAASARSARAPAPSQQHLRGRVHGDALHCSRGRGPAPAQRRQHLESQIVPAETRVKVRRIAEPLESLRRPSRSDQHAVNPSIGRACQPSANRPTAMHARQPRNPAPRISAAGRFRAGRPHDVRSAGPLPASAPQSAHIAHAAPPTRALAMPRVGIHTRLSRTVQSSSAASRHNGRPRAESGCSW